eukprot:4584823-Pleurochrysis_carterae.AAC.3
MAVRTLPYLELINTILHIYEHSGLIERWPSSAAAEGISSLGPHVVKAWWLAQISAMAVRPSATMRCCSLLAAVSLADGLRGLPIPAALRSAAPVASTSRSLRTVQNIRRTPHACRASPVISMKWDVQLAPWQLEYGLQDPSIPLPTGALESGAPAPFEITDEQRARLIEDGVVHIPGLLNDEWLEYLRSATDWQVRGFVCESLPSSSLLHALHRGMATLHGDRASGCTVQNPHFWSVAGVVSGLYDYIQRSIWSSNSAFANFMYYSPLASALAGLSNAEELRLATDLLMVRCTPIHHFLAQPCSRSLLAVLVSSKAAVVGASPIP